MGIVIAFVVVRAARLKAKLCAFAERRQAAVVRARAGVFFAYRIFCREQVAILIDQYGIRTQLGYGEIIDTMPLHTPAVVISKARKGGADPGAGSATPDNSNVIMLRRPDPTPSS